MEDILSGRNGRNVLQPVVEEPRNVQELAPTLHQKTKGKLVLNRDLNLRRLKTATLRTVVRT